MELVSPGIGLLFWMVLSFGTVLFILGKYAWKPILKALKNRENSIHEALRAADRAKEDMKKLQADHEAVLREARMERENLLKEAREAKEKIIEDAREKAGQESEKIMEATRTAIINEKMAAVNEIKQQVAFLSVEIAEKILRQKLSDSREQKELIEKMIREMKLN